MKHILVTIFALSITACTEKTTDTSTNADTGGNTTEDTGTTTEEVYCDDPNIDLVIDSSYFDLGGTMNITIPGDPSLDSDTVREDIRVATYVVCNNTGKQINLVAPPDAGAYGWSDGGPGEGCNISFPDHTLAYGIHYYTDDSQDIADLWVETHEFVVGGIFTFGVFADVDTSACADFGVSFPNDSVWSVPFTIEEK